MTSQALTIWRSTRLVRLDRLLAAHPESVGSATDPAVAKEWTDALVLRLASEFQGFCRDLHNFTVNSLVDLVTVSSPHLSSLLTNGLISGRGLNRRSADPTTIDADFARLGLNLWPALAASWPESTSTWRQALVELHRARNGVAHDDEDAIAAVQDAGWALHLSTVRKWRNLLDETVVAVDSVVSKDITERFGRYQC
jgi:hypothetical protein